MLSALRSIRSQLPTIATSPYNLSRAPGRIRFFPSVAGTKLPENSGGGGGEMDQTSAHKVRAEQNINSFGEGYASRSNEEGFGGVYSENQQLKKNDDHKISVHANVPEFDTSQGSQVKEKEGARNQHRVAS